MTASLQQLGETVKVYRQARRITQSQLAARISPRTNRSVVAHLEQGIRLPPRSALRSICRYLEIPTELWLPFEIEAVRLRTVQELNAGSTPQGLPHFISISGLQASGKTTLARKLASLLGYSYIGQSIAGKEYLPDLKKDPTRWAYETQVAFLCHKAFEISETLGKSRRTIIDRSIYEDVNIFAQSFFNSGNMDHRAFETYKALANHFIENIPPPELVIFCEVAPTTSFARIRERAREDANLNTQEQINALHNLYTQWISSHKDSSIWAINSEQFDWRTDDVAKDICAELSRTWSKRATPESQLTLFDMILSPADTEPAEPTQRYFTIVHEKPRASGEAPRLSVASVTPLYPTAYIAAPFTNKAKAEPKRKKDLVSEKAPHGLIAPGRYRSMLLGIEKTLKSMGIHSFIPHRDVNKWGRRTLTPDKVFQNCSNAVEECDLIISIPGLSHGTHYELGLAIGLKKPSIIIHCDEIKESFISTGAQSTSELILPLSCKKTTEIPLLLATPEATAFLKNYFPMNTN
ncbi:deoxynucleoside kinase [Corallococcus exiguus]|uniref:deoxynucleoside kinase n=1 Tax=Corallococcus exiguus TaxID=83462 RepID=UPI003DA54266